MEITTLGKKPRIIEKIEKPVMSKEFIKFLESNKKNSNNVDSSPKRSPLILPIQDSIISSCEFVQNGSKSPCRQFSSEVLIHCTKSPYALRPPHNWNQIQKNYPMIVREK